MSSQPVTLYGVPHSLYTGRARSYLIKAGIDYREQAPNTEHYQKTVVPLAGGRRGVPTLELADGSVIRDGAAIIAHFEAASGNTFSPSTPRQRFVSRLFDAIGAEGFLRPAMHYRWNFDEENLSFLLYHFEMITPPTDEGRKMALGLTQQMRQAGVAFGATPETFELVESLYADQLAALDQHFAAYPYLLGGRPSIGDFGMIAPLFAHLGRDPKPLALMQAKAPHVFRWVERMNRVDGDVAGSAATGDAYLPGDEIPQSLTALMAAMAEDFMPETLAAADAINAWIAAQDDLASGTPCSRGLGFGQFEVRGTPISALAQPYRFYLLRIAQEEFEAMEAADQKPVREMLEACGMSALLTVKLTRDVGLKGNLEVWL